MSAAASDPAVRPRLVSDGTRYALSVAITVVLVAVLAAVYGFLVQGGIGSLGFVVTVYFGTWSAYSFIYAGLTWTVLHPADGITLRDWLAENRSERRRRRRTEWLTASGGPLGAVSFCAVAIGAVVWAAVLPELRSDPVVVGLAGLVVAASWLLIVTVYAVHYARENRDLDSLTFHDTDGSPPRLSDYWFVAVQVSTAYNTADVTVTSRAMRRTVTLHAVVAFVFNSVLIALLVSLLITVTT